MKTDLTLLPLPTFRWPFEATKVERSRLRLANDTVVRDGIIHWKSNDAVVPGDVFKDAYVAVPDGQEEARKREDQAFAAKYRKLRANHQPSGEELAEMRAEFGEGAVVVDVITGRRTRL